MSRYQLTPQAVDDLFEIWTFIASDNVAAANAVEQALMEALDFLAESRLAGPARPELAPHPLRVWTVQRFPNYLVVYDPGSEPLRVIRILHGKRDVRRLFP